MLKFQKNVWLFPPAKIKSAKNGRGKIVYVICLLKRNANFYTPEIACVDVMV